MKDIIPKNKFDVESVVNLNRFSVGEIREEIPFLLEWLQDFNWPVAKPIAVYFSLYVKDIDAEIANILKTNDEVWKYWILLLVEDSKSLPGQNTQKEVLRIGQYPTKGEIEEELHEIAARILMKL
jgi:hypothetical protein